MKSFKLAVIALTLCVGAALIPRHSRAASPYNVTTSTVVPNGSVNGSAAFTAASYPNFTGSYHIRKITLDNLASPQSEKVQVWSTCTSSTTATLKWEGVVKASDSLNVDFLPTSFPVTSPCINKGTVDSNSVIKATVIYE